MFSLAVIKAIQVYGIAIAISMFVAVLIKLLVMVTGRIERPAMKTVVSPTARTSLTHPGIPDEVVAAISGAISIVTGPHRILHIAEGGTGWTEGGRAALHASHSGHFQPKH